MTVDVSDRRPAFQPPEAYRSSTPYQLLPFRFARIPAVDNRVLVTSEAGEWLFLSNEAFQDFVQGRLDSSSEAYADLSASQFLYDGNRETTIRLLAAKCRTKKSFLRGGPKLHMFVVTLRCDHSCHYCQVSRQATNAHAFDMSETTAIAAIDRVFDTPAKHLTVEFQGGEPLLAFQRIRQIVERVAARAHRESRRVSFTMTSTLHQATDEILQFLKEHRVHLTTSLDGPEWLHDTNRPNGSRDSWRRTVEAIKRARAVLGHDGVAALVTLSRVSLDHPEAIVDAYVEQGFSTISLRPLTPLGFAKRSARRLGYSVPEYLAFYERAFSHILALNRSGIALTESYAALLLSQILTPYPTNYVDLRSPAGAGLGAIAYHYDGGVYASDEGRMLAEMDDCTFRMGNVHDTYQALMRSDAIQLVLATGISETLPGCSDCAFVPYCGADPVLAYARDGDPIGHRTHSPHCTRQTGLFHYLFKHLAEADPKILSIFTTWVTGRTPRQGAAA